MPAAPVVIAQLAKPVIHTLELCQPLCVNTHAPGLPISIGLAGWLGVKKTRHNIPTSGNTPWLPGALVRVALVRLVGTAAMRHQPPHPRLH